MNSSKHIQHRVSETSNILGNFLQYLPDLIWLVDTDCNLLAFNRRFQVYYHSITGKKIKKGMNFFEYIPEKYYRFWKSIFQKSINNQNFSTEQSFKVLNSKYFFELTVNKVKSGFQERDGLLVYGRDITKRKLYEEKLINSEKKFRKLFEESPLGIGIVCSDTYKIVDSNKSLTSMLEYSLEELKNLSVVEITHPEDISKEWDFVNKLQNGEIPSYTIEKRFITKSKKTLWAKLTSTAIKTEEGKSIYGIGIVENITEQKSTFNSLLKSQENLKLAITEAENANQAKISFLSNISHELRTPINSIIGFTELINSDERLPADLKKFSEALLNNGNHLIDLTNDLIDLSKIEAGKIELKEEAFYLEHLINSIKDMFFLECEKRGINLSLNLSEKIPKIILSDKNRLKQVLINLVGNAIKFTPQGKVDLSVKLISENRNKFLNRKIYKLRFEVKDNGQGIPEDKVQTIFQPFEQGRFNKVGSGLGLSISALLVKMMGGEINIWSKENLGTCFWFEIFIKALSSVQTINPITKDENQENTTHLPVRKVKEILPTLYSLPYTVFKAIKESIEVQDFQKLHTILNEIQPSNNKDCKNIDCLKEIIDDYDYYMIKLLSDSLENLPSTL
ncbi:MAG: PAS domain S-box protein [Leptospiraceae bacterium]|nr:PAS domain S-box protein [Leptospiraceae bacterium]